MKSLASVGRLVAAALAVVIALPLAVAIGQVGGGVYGPPTSPQIVAGLGYTPANKAGDTLTGVLIVPAGSAAAPTVAFATDNVTGLYSRAANVLNFAAGGNLRFEMAAAILRGSSTSVIGFGSSTASSTADTTISRVAAGVLGCGTGAAASVAGQCYGATLRTGQTTVTGLPTCSTVGEGARAYVTDAATTLVLGLGLTVTGGGANKTPVYCDGTNWIYG